MNNPIDNWCDVPRDALEWLANLLLQLAQERSVDRLLECTMEAVAAVPDVALARVYLLGPGDQCEVCPSRKVCPDQRECLHAEVTQGFSLRQTEKPFSQLSDPYLRVPLGAYRVGQAAATGETLVVNQSQEEDWIANVEWAEKEEVRSYLCQPIEHAGTVLGVLAVFLRRPPGPAAAPFSRILADHLGTAIANTRAFAEIERLKEQLMLHNDYLREEIHQQGRFGAILGQSSAIANVIEQVDLVAPTDATVLIWGESGTGKELVAREIHQRSLRCQYPLVKVNCAALPAELFESELFGHVKGAFTGAIRDRPGRFEVADGGTLFLDEVGEIPLHLQSKLLRVLQEGTYERVGQEQARQVNVRLIAATNRDLKVEMKAGRFRDDLYYRLHVFPITVPSLRERLEDVPLLASHFLQNTCQRLRLPCPPLTQNQLQQLQTYDWPGNVRELENVLERAAILARRGGQLYFHLGREVVSSRAATSNAEVRTDAEIRQIERENVLAALEKSGGRVRGPEGAAELLGLKPTTLAARIKALGIQKPE